MQLFGIYFIFDDQINFNSIILRMLTKKLKHFYTDYIVKNLKPKTCGHR